MFGNYKKILTNEGAKLHAKCLAGEVTSIQFTKFALGSGTYEGTEETAKLAASTELKESKKEFPVTKVEVVNHDTCKVTMNATNLEITEGFSVTEVGLFAKGSNEQEILYSITVADPEHPDWIEAYNSVAPASLRYVDVISVGNADSIEITVTPGGLVSIEDFEKLEVETGTQYDILDREYRGVNLAEKFADEIGVYIASEEGKAAYEKVSEYADGHEDELKSWVWMKHRINKKDSSGIHDGDWLKKTIHCTNESCESCPFHTECQGTLKTEPETHEMQVVGKGTYHGTGWQEWHHKYSSVVDKETSAIPYHIDFISRDLLTPAIKWNTSAVNCGEYCGKWVCNEECPNYSNRTACSYHQATANTTNCESCEKNTTCEYYKNKSSASDFCIEAGNDCPYSTSHVKAFLDFLYEHSAKAAYDGIISEKTMLGERRAYQYSKTQLTDSTGWRWYNFGKFWLPTEYEVHGSVVWGTTGWSAGQAVQYPLFAGRWDNKIKHIGPGGKSRGGWWEACARGGSSTDACYVPTIGHAHSNSAANAGIRVPVCFRIAAGDNQ